MSRSKLELPLEMWADWKEHPVTVALMEVLARKRQGRKDDWESGNVLEFGKDEHMLRNAAAIGECQGFKFVEELTYETLKGEIDEERERTDSAG